jgi:hypothetical protein
MYEEPAPMPTDPHVLAERARNIDIVRAYLSIKGGAAVKERMAMFHEEIVNEIMFTEEGITPERTIGLKKLQEKFEADARCWGEYAYTNIKYIPSEYPDKIIVEWITVPRVGHEQHIGKRSRHNRPSGRRRQPSCFNKPAMLTFKSGLSGWTLTKKFLSVKGNTINVERMEFTTDDGLMILPFAYGNDPRDDNANKVLRTFKQRAELHSEDGHDNYRDWELFDGQIYSTPDPDTLYIECSGRSRYFSTVFPELSWYENHYLLRLTFKDGKMHNVLEPFNPYNVFRSLGWHKEPKIL